MRIAVLGAYGEIGKLICMDLFDTVKNLELVAVGRDGKKLIELKKTFRGKKIELKNYYYSFLPSIHIQYALLLPPSVDIGCMMYVKSKIGFGLSSIQLTSLAGIVYYYKVLLYPRSLIKEVIHA